MSEPRVYTGQRVLTGRQIEEATPDVLRLGYEKALGDVVLAATRNGDDITEMLVFVRVEGRAHD